ncbi:hypothetical protein BsWGS_23467 [Bradybaena similaris]
MSGRIAANSGFVTKAEFTRMQSKMESIASKMVELSREIKVLQQPSAPPSVGTNRKFSGGVKSWLYSKAGSRTPRGQLSSSNDTIPCHNCGNESPATQRHLPGSDAGKHIYQKHVTEAGPDEHRHLQNEMNLLQTEVKNEIRSLQKSVKDVQELCKSLEKLVNDSISDLQTTIDRMKKEMAVNTERPDHQGLQMGVRNVTVNRDDKRNSKLENDDPSRVLRKHITAI